MHTRYSEIVRHSAAAATLAVALFSASSSKAGTLVVDFDLSGSALQATNVIDVADGRGAKVSGAARIAFTGVNAAGAITDAMATATLSDLTLSFQVNAPLGAFRASDANLVGSLGIVQMGMTSGPFDGTSVSLAQNAFNLSMPTHLDCIGPLCSSIASAVGISFPIVSSPTLTNFLGFSLSLTGLDSMAMVSSLVGIGASPSAPLTLTLGGREVGRKFVPEPLEAALLMLGALLLCSVAVPRSRQRASSAR